MAKRVEIRFTDNPSNNDSVSFDIIIPSMFWNTVTTFIFKTTPSPFTDEIQIGVNKEQTMYLYFYNFLINKYNLFDWITVTQVTNGIDILFDVTDFTNNFNTIVGDITINFVDVSVDPFTRDNIILSRSPFNMTFQPTVLLDSATVNLRLYRGTLTDDSPATATYTLSKQVIQAGQTAISFEISKYINDYCKSNIIPFGTTGVNTSSSFDSVWCDAEITAYYYGEAIGSTNRQYLGIDAFGWHTELYNPKLTKNVLTTNTNHIVYRGSDYPLYFVSKDLVSITVNGNTVAFTLDETINNQIIGFINIGAYVGNLNSFTAVFNYGATTETHTFKVKDECRFDVYNCFFKNKYGFWQSIPFNLRNKKTITVESEDYRPIISVFGQYSLQSHNKKTFNPELKEVINCNTDYLPEHYNDVIEEMFASESVYLELNGEYLPVNLDKKSFEKKQKKFDKLIQYTIDFEYSFNKINQVI